MAAHSLWKLPSTTIVSQPSYRSTSKHNLSSLLFQNPWLLGTKNVNKNSGLYCQFSSFLKPHQPNYRPITATVLSSLPTARPDSTVSTEKAPKWSWRAIKSFAMSELEARKLKYPNTGTEALLMGILIEGTGFAAKFLRAKGVTLSNVREEAIKLLGKGDMYFFSPEHPPLTKSAQRAIDWAIEQKQKTGDGGEITTCHLLLGIWCEADSPGHKILAALGFNDEKAKELESLTSKPGFVDD